MRPGPVTKATFRTSGVLLLRLGIQATSLLVVARMLGPKEFGAFAGLAAAAVFLGALATFGTHTILLRGMSRDPHQRGAVLSRAIGTTLVTGALLLLAYLLLAQLTPAFQAASAATILAIGASELVLGPLLVLAATERQATGRIAQSQALLLLPLTLRLFCAIVILRLAPAEPLDIYVACHLSASAIALIIAITPRSWRWPPISTWRIVPRDEMSDSIGFALSAMSSRGPTEFDKVLAAQLLALPAAGAYAVASRAMGAAVLPVVAMMLSAIPRLFADAHAGRRTRLPAVIFIGGLAYGIAAGAVMWVAAPRITPLFGAGYQDVGDMLRWLSLAAPALGLRIAAANILMTATGPWHRMRVEALGIVILASIALLAIPAWGTGGMLIAAITSEWAMALDGWRRIIGGKSPPAASSNTYHLQP